MSIALSDRGLIKVKSRTKRWLAVIVALVLTIGCLTIYAASTAVPMVTVSYNYGAAWQQSIMFYEFQQSGEIGESARNNWRGDSGMLDGKDVGLDLTGGWYDAGDHVKFNLPMAYSSTMLAWSYLESKSVYETSGEATYLLEQLKGVNDYFMKCHPEPNVYYYQVGNGAADHAFWGAAEVLPMERPSYKVDLNNPGSAVCAQTAASLAACAMIFQEIDPEYAKKCLTHAKQLLSFAEVTKSDSGYSQQAGGFYPSSSFYDDLSWAGIWLYRATGDSTYLNKAKTYAKEWGVNQWGSYAAYDWAQCWDDVHYGAALLIAQYDSSSDAKLFKTTIENHLDYWTTGLNGNRVPYTPKGLAYRNEWGSLRYATTTAFLATIYADWSKGDSSRKQTYEAFAKSQADYVLGSSGRSFLVGYDETSPRNVHHRTAHGAWENNVSGAPSTSRHVLVGALVGGPDSNDYYEDRITDYQKNEVACDYNAGLVGLMAKLYEDYGGTLIENLSAVEAVGEEYIVSSTVNAQYRSTQQTFLEMRTVIQNHTAWPARVSSALKLRYFVDLKSVLAKGIKTSDIKITTNYTQHPVTVSSLKVWDAKKGIYYIEVDLSSAKIYPGGLNVCQSEVQFRITIPGDWDYTQNPSYEVNTSGQLMPATKMALYEGANLEIGRAHV